MKWGQQPDGTFIMPSLRYRSTRKLVIGAINKPRSKPRRSKRATPQAKPEASDVR